MFIAIEGPDCGGKDTQQDLLVEFLRDAFPEKHIASPRNPGTTALGVGLRKLLLDKDIPCSPRAQMLGFLSASAQLLDEIPKGTYITVCNRYHLSALVYQGLLFPGGEDAVAEITRLALGDTEPDLYVLLDAPDDLLDERLAAKCGAEADRFESNREAMMKYRNRYRALIKRTAVPRLWLVAQRGEKPLEVCARIVDKIAELKPNWDLRNYWNRWVQRKLEQA